MKPATKSVTKSTRKSKPATKPQSIGTQLRARRLQRELSLADVERTTRIRGKYLTAIEADDYQALPQGVYAKGFIQSYADFLGFDGRSLAASAMAERQRQTRSRSRRPLATARLILTPRLLSLLGGILAALAIATYLITQFQALTAPPQLTVGTPNRDQVVYGSLITVSGHVSSDSDVFVNSSPILVDGNGNFADTIALQNGINNIQISAKNSLGKTTLVTRNILAHVPQVDANSILPTATFDGVAVSVKVQFRATTVSVRIDGKTKFNGTMLPGTIQTFKGTGSVVIATSDGGATFLTITNSTVANKNLGAVGRGGQTVTDFEFDKDTHFQ